MKTEIELLNLSGASRRMNVCLKTAKRTLEGVAADAVLLSGSRRPSCRLYRVDRIDALANRAVATSPEPIA